MPPHPAATARLLIAMLCLGLGLMACAPRTAPLGAAAAGEPALTRDALVMPDGTELPLRRWPPEAEPAEPKAVILGVHGFNDYSMGFDQPGSYFAARGYLFYAYDQRGFGAAPHPGVWPGTQALVRDLAAAIRLLRQRHPDTPLYLLGTSMGGAVILAAAGGAELPPVDGVVLAAPAVWARATMPFYQRWALWLAAHTVPWLTLSGAGLEIQASDNIVALRTLGMDPLVIKATRVDAMHGLVNLMDAALAAAPALPTPALLLYGEKDEIVPPGPTLELWQAIDGTDGVDFALYPEGWHLLLRDQQAYTVWRDIVSWIEDGRDGLPSTADERAAAALRLGEIPLPNEAVAQAEQGG